MSLSRNVTGREFQRHGNVIVRKMLDNHVSRSIACSPILNLLTRTTTFFMTLENWGLSLRLLTIIFVLFFFLWDCLETAIVICSSCSWSRLPSNIRQRYPGRFNRVLLSSVTVSFNVAHSIDPSYHNLGLYPRIYHWIMLTDDSQHQI